MHLIVFAWLYIALMISLSQWPDILAMVGIFLLAGILPSALLLHGLRGSATKGARAAQRARRDTALMQETVGRGDDADTEKNQE